MAIYRPKLENGPSSFPGPENYLGCPFAWSIEICLDLGTFVLHITKTKGIVALIYTNLHNYGLYKYTNIHLYNYDNQVRAQLAQFVIKSVVILKVFARYLVTLR